MIEGNAGEKLMTVNPRFVVITGATGGIGSKISLDLMERGWSVALCSTEEDRGLFCSELLRKTGSEIFTADLTVDEEVANLVRKIKSWCGGTLHGLVNNAGRPHGGLIQQTPLAELKRIYDINTFALINITQKLHRYMRRAGGASIVNISSISSLMPNSGQVAYASSKAAVNAITKTMASEYSVNNIRVNAILPAVSDSGMSVSMSESAVFEQLSLMAAKVQIPKEDISELVLFLLENNIKSLTGQLIRIDNGMSI